MIGLLGFSRSHRTATRAVSKLGATGEVPSVRYGQTFEAIDETAITLALERERVRCIVRQRDMNPEFPPLAALYPALDGYVTRNYRHGRVLAAGGQVWHGLSRSTPFGQAGGARAPETAP